MNAIRPLLLVWLMLLALLTLTVGASFVFTGPASLIASLGIALAKAALVYWFFMRLKDDDGVVRLVALGVFAWLAIMFFLTGLDYVTR